jgi:hypothetical protein
MVPYDSANNVVHKFGVKKYKNNKDIMNNIKVKDVPQLKKYLTDSYNNISKNNKDINFNNILLKREEIIELYNEYKNEGRLLKEFIKKFLIKYDKSCLLFYSFYDTLFDDLGLYDFHSKYYAKFLN